MVLSLKDTPFSIVTRKKNKQNAYLSYQALKKKYEGQEISEYLQLLEDFMHEKMKSPKEDPELYIARLEKISDKMECIDATYEKTEIEIIAQAINNLPRLYEGIIDAMNLQRKMNDLDFVRDELHKKWRNKYGFDSSENEDNEEAEDDNLESFSWYP